MTRSDNSLIRCVLSDVAATELEQRYEHRRRLWYDGPYGGSVAFDKIMEREVALYIAYNFSDIPRFIRTAKLRGRLRHAHILPVFDFRLTKDNLPYFTQPWVEAQPLDYVLRNAGQQLLLSFEQALDVLAGVCRAVAYAHEKSVYHLELSPGEVQVTQDLEDVFVTGGWSDLLSGSAEDPDRPVAHVRISAYAAPEQVQYATPELLQKGYGQLADIYALGGILYYILYGVAPNQAPSGADKSVIRTLGTLVGAQGPPQPGQLRPGIQTSAFERTVQGIERICLKALHRDQRERYQTVNEMLSELEE